MCCDRVSQGKGKVCRDRASLCRDRVGQCKENFCSNKVFLWHDRASQGKEKLCRDRDNLCPDRVGCDRKFYRLLQSWTCADQARTTDAQCMQQHTRQVP